MKFAWHTGRVPCPRITAVRLSSGRSESAGMLRPGIKVTHRASRLSSSSLPADGTRPAAAPSSLLLPPTGSMRFQRQTIKGGCITARAPSCRAKILHSRHHGQSTVVPFQRPPRACTQSGSEGTDK